MKTTLVERDEWSVKDDELLCDLRPVFPVKVFPERFFTKGPRGMCRHLSAKHKMRMRSSKSCAGGCCVDVAVLRGNE